VERMWNYDAYLRRVGHRHFARDGRTGAVND
jgi:hypothetical protein